MLQTLNVQPVIQHAGNFIKTEDAQEIIANWQDLHPHGTFSILYGRHVFDAILSTPNSAGIRIFNGINAGKKHAFVFAGTNQSGESILSNEDATIADSYLWDQGLLCPPVCVGEGPKLYLWRQPIDPSLNMQQIGTSISLEHARGMVNSWQQQHPEAITSFVFGRTVIEALLNVPKCEGIVFYNALDADHIQTLVALPADAAGRCILNYPIISPEGTSFADEAILSGGIKEHRSL